MPMAQKQDIPMGMDDPVSYGEPLVQVVSEEVAKGDYLKQLAFNEEPVTVYISENSRSELPETHVPCFVNGKGAEVLKDGKWISFGWLPIGVQLVLKRKYVEVLARSRADLINTISDDATVEKPRNFINRKTHDNYPMSIIHDANPRGHDWLRAVRANHA